MIEIGNLEEAAFKIQRLLKWFETEANIDKASAVMEAQLSRESVL